MVDLKTIDIHEIQEIVSRSAGLVLGMPPLSDNPQTQISNKMGAILASVKAKQIFGLYECYGGDDEPIDPIATKLSDLGLKTAFTPIRIKETPHESTYQICEESGTDLGQTLTQTGKIKQRKALNSELDKAMGRLSGGLYIITAQKGETTGAMLASWVTQASFEPPGFTVAVAKDRAIESLLQVEDTFVLNILEEGKYQALMKHFLKRFPPGADRFAGVKTQTALNQSPILVDALAYLESVVISRMDCGDHWVVYSKVTNGRVSKPDGLTAVHHRKVGNYY
jgi:flavin reductase (DIM6/NTAB) family NADH-FMN oxidoreductase RutF